MNAPTRREKLRQQTFDEIKQRARAQLVADGPQAISLRAIAREMGMAPAALYRYFPSLIELSRALVADLYHELADELVAAAAQIPPANSGERLGAVSRAFRNWALAHRSEFALVFGGAHTGGAVQAHQSHPEVHEALRRFCEVFAEAFNQMWRAAPYAVPSNERLGDVLVAQLAAHPISENDELPPGARYVFLSCWIWLYGFVAAEVFGHLTFAFEDGDAMFDAQMHDLGRLIGLKD